MEWYEHPNNNCPVMLDLDEKGYNVNSIHPNLLNTRIADAYMTYNPVIRLDQNWIGKTTYIPIGSDPALSNSHSFNGDQRRAASVEKDGSPLENNPCRVKRAFIYDRCHRDVERPGHICTIHDKDDDLVRKHNRWMSCRNARAEFQNSNCRTAADSSIWVDPDDYGHLQRIKKSAKEAEECVKIYNDPERVARRAFEAGEELAPPPVPIAASAASSVHAKLRQRIAPHPVPIAASAASSVHAKLRQRIAPPPVPIAASAASSVQPKILRSSIPPHAVAASAASSVPPPVAASPTPKPSSKFRERLAAALVKPNKFLSKRKKSKTKNKTKKSKKSKKKSKKKSIRRR